MGEIIAWSTLRHITGDLTLSIFQSPLSPILFLVNSIAFCAKHTKQHKKVIVSRHLGSFLKCMCISLHGFRSVKGDGSTKNENYPVIYSPSSHPRCT